MCKGSHSTCSWCRQSVCSYHRGNNSGGSTGGHSGCKGPRVADQKNLLVAVLGSGLVAALGAPPPKVKPGKGITLPCGKLGIQNSKKKIYAWHATKKSSVSGIKKHGLQPSKTGRLGPGCYFSLRPEQAWNMTKAPWCGGQGAVVKVEITTNGKIFNAGFDTAWGNTWTWPVGIVKSKHPAWPDAGQHEPFTEMAVRDTKRIKILKITS
jgi:hypothetical protein